MLMTAADYRETLRAYVNKVRPKKIILVHGDMPAIEWFRQHCLQRLAGRILDGHLHGLIGLNGD